MAQQTLVIGLAGRGLTWARAVAAHPDFELAGIAEIDENLLNQRGDDLKLTPEQRHLDYKQALASKKYDTTVIVLPNHLHYPVTKDILNAGCHCLVEKPFTLEIAHAEELVELAATKNLGLVVSQNYRFEPSCLFIADFVRKQRLGRLSGIEGTFYMHRPPRFDHERKMQYPMLFIQGVHHLDWLLSLLPTPLSRIQKSHRRPSWSEWDNPAICHIILECTDGVLVSYRGSYESKGDVSGYPGLWRFEFKKGSLVLEKDNSVWQVTDRGNHRERLWTMGPGHKSGNDWLLDGLHQTITTGAEAPTSGRNNLETLKLLFELMNEK